MRIVEDWGNQRQFAYLNLLGAYKTFNCTIKIQDSKGKEQVIKGMRKQLSIIGPNFNDFLFYIPRDELDENNILQIFIELEKNPFMKKVLGNRNKLLKKQVIKRSLEDCTVVGGIYHVSIIKEKIGEHKEIVLKSDQKLILKENLKFYEESLIQNYWDEFNLKGYLLETTAKLQENEAKILSKMKELENLSKKLLKIQKETEKKEKEKIEASNAAEILMELSTSQTKARLYYI
uniref:SMC hinge domain-containing protein n=1 Tax=Meloidogyne floridensis TaxID=298350 RepID=A0A915P7Z2_9BILA